MLTLVAAALSVVIAPICILIYRIVFPRIISYPWVMPPDTSRRRKLDKEMTVVFAGSFNPPHRGHLVMIQYLAERYGRVICCVGINPKKRYDVSPHTRAQLIREMIASTEPGSANSKNNHNSNIDVEVVSGYIWRYAKTQKASLFYRGIRTWSADGSEETQLQILNTWGPLLLGPTWPVRTVFLEGDPQYRDVSSTMVRQICARSKTKENGEGGQDGGSKGCFEELSKLVPDRVLEKVIEAYGR